MVVIVLGADNLAFIKVMGYTVWSLWRLFSLSSTEIYAEKESSEEWEYLTQMK